MSRKRLSAYLLPRRRFVGTTALTRDSSAFLEALMVVGIIAVLAAVAIRSQLPFLERAVAVEAASLQRTQASFVAEHYAVTGEFPDAVSTSASGGRFFHSGDWIDDEIVFELGGQLPGRLSALAANGKITLSFRIATTSDGGRFVVLCGKDQTPSGFSGSPSRHTSVPASLLPSFCRA